MPSALTYPGVYIEEIPSGVRTITGVATSITAFIGRALRGPVNDPVTINSFADYERNFGGLWLKSTMSFAVRDFFINGGSQAIIARFYNPDSTTAKTNAAVSLPTDTTTPLILEAASPGAWGNNLRVSVNHDTKSPENTTLFNLKIEEKLAEETLPRKVEDILNVSYSSDDARFVTRVLSSESRLMRVKGTVPTSRPRVTTSPITVATIDKVTDGKTLDATVVTGSQADKTGLYSLEKADLFNILCIPPYLDTLDVDNAVLSAAAQYCTDRRAFLLVDPKPEWKTKADAKTNLATKITDVVAANKKNAALFFPRLKIANPLRENQIEEFAPCGAVAGIFARTDAARGVWKAPAGLEAGVNGISGLTVPLTDAENGELNPLGVNCIRNMPAAGNVVWGSRTLDGNDRLASEWKYIPVRRMALFLEESLYRGTQWIVFEPNDEPLWSQIRLNLGAFMHSLFRQGAFQGMTPKEAYFVKCDKDTTTQDDINKGIVNILVGFAPLKPAEFVVIKIQQMAGQVQS